MFGRKRVPVLRIDRIGSPGGSGTYSDGTHSDVPAHAIRYTFSTDPESPRQVESWDALNRLLQSLGSGENRVGVRFAVSVGERRVAAEAFGSGRLDRIFLRWSDSGLITKSAPPWWITTAAPSGKLVRVPLGDVPANFDELSPDDYEEFAGLDLAAVPSEAVVSVADATFALRWFLETWPDESSPCLDWIAT